MILEVHPGDIIGWRFDEVYVKYIETEDTRYTSYNFPAIPDLKVGHKLDLSNVEPSSVFRKYNIALEIYLITELDFWPTYYITGKFEDNFGLQVTNRLPFFVLFFQIINHNFLN